MARAKVAAHDETLVQVPASVAPLEPCVRVLAEVIALLQPLGEADRERVLLRVLALFSR